SLSISSTTHRVEYAGSLVLTGVVADDEGAGLEDVKVALMQLEDGEWQRVGSGTTDEDGAVSLVAPPVYENTAMRLRTKDARSERWRVRVRPELRLAPTVDGDTVTIVAAATGGHAGDVVTLSGRRDGQRVTLATGILGADGTVTFQVQQEARKARYAGRLEPTERHTVDRVAVVVVKPQPQDDDEETPPPSP
ncbi:hypothetical protein, partial [Nocardioides sp.]|uniref:hypothetical protein n=1 Tax=Nocardioides sp. TaxID=35761 RepID=UPI001A1AEEDF